MATPNRRYSGASLQDLAPSGSFLRQLLEEISGTASPSALHTAQGTPQIQPRSAKRRHSSSVWVGGTSIARDARKKLRAADEARFVINGSDGTLVDSPKPKLQLRIPRYDGPAQLQRSDSAVSTPGDPWSSPDPRCDYIAQNPGHLPRRDMDSIRPRHRPSAGLLKVPSPTSRSPLPSLGYNQATGLPSPLIFVDDEIDSSKAASSSEEPTSAGSNSLTDASTLSNEAHATYSPRARLQSHSEVPESALRQARIMTAPEIPGRVMSRSEASPSRMRRSVGVDNRYVVRGPTFTERAVSSIATGPSIVGTTPELSSFRPQAVDAQGVPYAFAASSYRVASQVPREESPKIPDSPSYDRSLHLVDGEFSVYQKTHGDEWREAPLCLYCFRQHGTFSKLGEHGCETCGQGEALQSHYWE